MAHISTRTPEGRPNACPLCGALIIAEPSEPLGDVPCPSCGSLLLFAAADDNVVFYSVAWLPDEVRRRFAELLKEFSNREALDSLDAVELHMELEDIFDFTVPDEEASMWKTAADVIDYCVRRFHEPRE